MKKMNRAIGTCNACFKYGRLWKAVETDDGMVTLCKKCVGEEDE